MDWSRNLRAGDTPRGGGQSNGRQTTPGQKGGRLVGTDDDLGTPARDDCNNSADPPYTAGCTARKVPGRVNAASSRLGHPPLTPAVRQREGGTKNIVEAG